MKICILKTSNSHASGSRQQSVKADSSRIRKARGFNNFMAFWCIDGGRHWIRFAHINARWNAFCGNSFFVSKQRINWSLINHQRWERKSLEQTNLNYSNISSDSVPLMVSRCHIRVRVYSSRIPIHISSVYSNFIYCDCDCVIYTLVLWPVSSEISLQFNFGSTIRIMRSVTALEWFECPAVPP